MNPIVAQRHLLREIVDEVLQSQPPARYESPPADPVYLKGCLARRHLCQLTPSKKLPYAAHQTWHRSDPFPHLKAERYCHIARTTEGRLSH
jgi:hypothetical protein